MRDGECGIADSGGHNIRMCVIVYAQVPRPGEQTK